MKIETYRYENIGGDRTTILSNYNVQVTVGDIVHEGSIVIGHGRHGAETYPYVSHIEWEENGLNEEQTEEVETYLQDNYQEMIVNAEKI